MTEEQEADQVKQAEDIHEARKVASDCGLPMAHKRWDELTFFKVKASVHGTSNMLGE